MKRAKRFFSILLTLCIVLGMIPGTVSAANSNLPFTDVKETDWFYDAVKFNYENGLMVGTGANSFSPEATTTRGMIGYSFEGWYTAEKNGEMFDFNTIITEDITLYAKWREKSPSTDNSKIYYIVTFDSNGGNEIPPQRIVAGGTATEPNVPTKEGFVFEGWYSDATLTTLYDFTLPVYANITLYAKWSEANNTITGSASSVDVFFISALRIDKENGEAVATVSAPENCALVVRFIEEDIYFSEDYPANKEYISEDTLYASHVVRAGTDMEEIVACIVGELPEYYVAEAVLMDGNGDLLCNPFASIEHTQRYEQFKQKSIYDFDDDDTILKFSDAIDNNFGVLADDVRIIFVQDLTFDESNNIYYLTGVTDTINVGDKLFISDGVNHALIRVKEVSETSEIIMVIPASADDDTLGFILEDFYKFIKVDLNYDGDVVTTDTPADVEYSVVTTMGLSVIDWMPSLT
ncbi:MAG: hypothetical protein GX022_08985 [Clostridiaceae bacterium]|nr:hypothetical protein [Clostridiaceae bacterium]